MTVQLPFLGPDGSVVFAAAEEFEACWTSALSRGAIVVRPGRELRPLEQLEVHLVIPGLDPPLRVRAETVSIHGERAMLRLVDGPLPKPPIELRPASPHAPVPSDAPIAMEAPPSSPPPSDVSKTAAFELNALLPPPTRAPVAMSPAFLEPLAHVDVAEAVPWIPELEPLDVAPSSSAASTTKMSLADIGLGGTAQFTGESLNFPSLGALMGAKESLLGVGAVLANAAAQLPAVPVDVTLSCSHLSTKSRIKVTVSLAAPGTAVVQEVAHGSFAALVSELETLATGTSSGNASTASLTARAPAAHPSGVTPSARQSAGQRHAPDMPAVDSPADAATATGPIPLHPTSSPSGPAPPASAGASTSSAPFAHVPGGQSTSKELRSFMKGVFEKYTAVEDPAAAPRPLSFAREGSLHNPTTPQDILNLPLARAPNDDELAFPSVPLLLRWLRTTRGILRLEVTAADQPVHTIVFVDGREVRSPASFATLGKALAAPSLTYQIIELGRPPQLTTSGRTLHLVGEVVRALCGHCEVDQLAFAFPDREGLCPRALPDIVAGLGFPAQHHRFIKTDVNGSHFLQSIARAPVGARVVWESLYLLELYNGLSWDSPPENRMTHTTGSFARPQSMETRPHHVEEASSPFDGKDHFHVLGLHWSSSPAEITPAYRSLHADYAAGGIKRPSDNNLAERILKQIDEAYRVLNNTDARKAYRREKFNLVWAHQAQLLVQKAKMSLYRKDIDEAEAILLAAEDISPSTEAQGILAAIRKRKKAK